ncbi:hypothetical protein [Candidatus Laterigemmans baculatus]|uniref:hypothetical protein n=1 Tax=Candidatus Laterigemmans baculatus TaxID=2770505 RepID=UPI0013DD09DE|nr:hypothetical protein [Candidatus Laterigemmans baculatus]
MFRRSMTTLALGMLCAAGAAPLTAAAEADYALQYKFRQGEQVRYRVVHMAKTKTRMGDTEETSQVRTVSVKVWDITEVNDEGDTRFNHGVASVEMSQQAGDAEEIRWDSTSDDIPPVQFSQVAERLGRTLGSVLINSQGQVKERSEGSGGSSSLGMGDVTMPLPANRVKVGDNWAVPREVRARNEAGTQKIIKIRELYTLEKVQTGVATISVRSEPLTPIEDQAVKSQLVQQLSNGTIRFDIDAGRVLSRQLDWDETVVGFQGASSMMEYRARLTEELEASESQRTARLVTPEDADY